MATTKIRLYSGEKLSVKYDLKRCMHAAECVSSGLKNVFDNTKRPWIDPDGSSPERVIDVVERCPSGALHYDFPESQEVPETNTIRPQPNSALYVRGDVTLKDHEGEIITQEPRLALCRCGQSNNKPFCDYSHHEAGFEDSGKLGSNSLSAESINTEDSLVITSSQHGPLLVQGAFALRSADHAHIRYGEKTALCRCGQSNNKPFCDGSHKAIGFRSD
jgi:CDGSH-type Zn-finger protein/uncharacterized Fe-S cluster protein YjdI